MKNLDNTSAPVTAAQPITAVQPVVAQAVEVKAEPTKNVGMTQFIQTWERVIAQGGKAKDVAKELGLKESSVTQRASTYRNKHSIALTMATRGSSEFDVIGAQAAHAAIMAELKAEASELAGDSATNPEG